MLVYSLDPILKKTAKALNFPLEKTAPVILHLFKEMRRNQQEFFTVGFQLEDLGKFRLEFNKMQLSAEILIKHIRANKAAVENRKILSNLFKFRHQVREYYDSRKYKKRFGS